MTFCEKVEKINCIIQDQQKPDKKIIHNILIHAFSVQERQCLPLELKQYLSMKDITLIKKDIDFYAVADDFRFSQSPIISAKEHQLQVDMELIQYILYGDKNFLQKRKAFAKMKL